MFNKIFNKYPVKDPYETSMTAEECLNHMIKGGSLLQNQLFMRILEILSDLEPESDDQT